MQNSNGDTFEKTPVKQEKRRRCRNRKGKAKVENLVSRTFQAKLEAAAALSHNGPSGVHIKSNTDNEVTTSTTVQHPKISKNDVIDNSSVKVKQKETKLKEESPIDPIKLIMGPSEKTREEILKEREAKKLAKAQTKKKKNEGDDKTSNTAKLKTPNAYSKLNNQCQEASGSKDIKPIAQVQADVIPVAVAVNASSTQEKAVLSKAERRAIQEAQRAAKAKTTKNNETSKKVENVTPSPKEHSENVVAVKISHRDCKVKLFNHLTSFGNDTNLFANNISIHPVIVKLGEQYAKRTVVGSNARCISFLSALTMVIKDYETPAKKEFGRSLERAIKDSVDHLSKCRPLAVSVCNAYKHIKHVLTQLPIEKPESELKEHLCHFIDTYIENQIEKAAQAISSSVQEKISNGDVILTFGCSSLIYYIFEEAHRRHVDFRVIVVDSRPFLEGQEFLRRLTAKEISCTYVLINAVGFVMPEVTKVLLGAHALLSNGYVMARTGTAQVALVARSFNVPVLVCCETHKFSERFQTDAIVYNELGNPNDLIISNKCRLMNWQSQNKLSPLNLNYDVTPPELVTAVVTEVAILPCTSVPVILRIKPTEIGY